MRAEGDAVESILRVLRQQGLEIAARTYRAWKRPARIAARTVTDALVEDQIRELAWTFNPASQRRQMTPEGLYGRRKWVALLRRQGLFKTECIGTTVLHGGPFRTLADVEFATADWVDWYNNRRLHGTLGILTPVGSETLHYEALTREPAPTK